MRDFHCIGPWAQNKRYLRSWDARPHHAPIYHLLWAYGHAKTIAMLDSNRPPVAGARRFQDIGHGVLVVGVGGGSGSGKTTLARHLEAAIGSDLCAVVSQDSYYRDLAHMEFEERQRVNFDHPKSVDATLMAEHVNELRSGRDVTLPQYDFARHVRFPEGRGLKARPLVVIEGILVLVWPEVRELMDLCVFVDAPEPVRLGRRLERDVSERGRDAEGVLSQYYGSVRPMHQQFVGPSAQFANLVVDGEGNLDASVSRVVQALTAIVELRPKRLTESG